MQQQALAVAFMEQDLGGVNPNVRIGIPNPGKTCQIVYQLLS